MEVECAVHSWRLGCALLVSRGPFLYVMFSADFIYLTLLLSQFIETLSLLFFELLRNFTVDVLPFMPCAFLGQHPHIGQMSITAPVFTDKHVAHLCQILSSQPWFLPRQVSLHAS